MSTEISAIIVNILAVVLPALGINVGTSQLTTTLQVILAIGAGLYLWYKRYQRGGVNVVGLRV